MDKTKTYIFGTPENPTNKLEKKFWEFHAQNPHVYIYFNRFTMEAINSGRKKFSISFVTERVRWYTAIETRGDDFKINNNFRAYYARLWMRNNPDFDGLFFTRTLTTKKRINNDQTS